MCCVLCDVYMCDVPVVCACVVVFTMENSMCWSALGSDSPSGQVEVTTILIHANATVDAKNNHVSVCVCVVCDGCVVC